MIHQMEVRFLPTEQLSLKLQYLIPAFHSGPSTTAQATVVARAFLDITRHLLQLERCSNPLRMRKVFLVLPKKNVFDRVRGSPGGGSQSGGVFNFLTNFDAPWTPIPWAKILAQTCFGN